MKLNKDIKVLNKMEKPIIKLSEKYCDNIDARTLIQNLPLIGGHLDSLLAYKGSKIIQERVKVFFEETKRSLNYLKEEKIDKKFLESDEGFYIFQSILDKVLRTNEKDKVKLFCDIFIICLPKNPLLLQRLKILVSVGSVIEFVFPVSNPVSRGFNKTLISFAVEASIDICSVLTMLVDA